MSSSAVFLEFLNAPAPGMPITEVPRLAVGVGEAMRSAVVDTGSTGVVLSATSIPDLDRLPSLGPGAISYSSSGRVMTGRWVVTPLTIAGAHQRVTTQPIAILAVEEITCTATARRCTPIRHPTGVAMLGIGFGREHDGQPGGTPDRNPLLTLAGSTRRAYVITRHGIGLGADPGGFTMVRLARDAARGDWSAPPACITLDNGPPVCGTVLVDTGISGMFLTLPADRLPPGDRTTFSLPIGSAIGIDLAPNLPGAHPGYTVRVGDRADPAAPSTVILSGIGRRPPFVNTGVHLLDRYDYLYDADAGIVGYRAASGATR